MSGWVGFAEKQHPKLQTFQVSKSACTTCGGSIPETFLIRKSGCCCLLCISYPISCMDIMRKVKYRNNKTWTNNFKISDHLKTDSVAACERDFWWPSVSLHQWHRMQILQTTLSLGINCYSISSSNHSCFCASQLTPRGTFQIYRQYLRPRMLFQFNGVLKLSSYI